MNNYKILAAQIEVKTGDIVGNSNKIIEVIAKAENEKYDFVVFPEMTISGYNCGDLFEKKDFIADCRKTLSTIVDFTSDKEVAVVIGCPRQDGSDLYNSAYVAYRGEIIGHYDKQLLANDYHHEDRKYFKAGNANKSFYLKGLRFAIVICEDAWKSYHRNILNELANTEHVDIVFSMNYSYFSFNKIQARENILKNTLIPLIYVNNIGVGDITKNFITYDGNSFIYDPYQKIKYFYPECPTFTECLFGVEYNKKGRSLSIIGEYSFSITNNKYMVIEDAITYAIREIFKQCGIKKAQVHISGGIDSAVVAYFAVQAMGAENCVFITQPSKNNGEATLNNAKKLSDSLGVTLEYDPISEHINVYKKGHPEASKAEIASFEAVVRKAIGFALTHKNKSGILACGNHTENVLGWFSFGDIGSMGVMQPIGDLTKVEIFELADHINTTNKREIIPKCLYDGSMKPAAELEDSSEDPFDYVIMSHICERIIRYGQSPSQIMEDMEISLKFATYSREVLLNAVNEAWRRSKFSVYKRAQSAPVLILSNRSIGFSSRETIINHYK